MTFENESRIIDVGTGEASWLPFHFIPKCEFYPVGFHWKKLKVIDEIASKLEIDNIDRPFEDRRHLNKLMTIWLVELLPTYQIHKSH